MNHYVLDHKLASGGMGEVFMARQVGPRGVERTCVIKKMFEHHADDPEFVSLFLEEARLSASLNHPNIAQVYEFGKGKTGYFLAMEHINGPSLQQLIEAVLEQREQIDIGLASKIIIQAALALDHAHRLKTPEGEPLNLVHRDVSPANLMLSTAGVVKLIDFGIAKSLTSPNWTSVRLANGERVVRGKLAYISPEQLWGYPIDGRADLFSLGLVWYELLTLQRAVRGATDQEIVASAREWKIAPVQRLRPSCPHGLIGCVNKAMARSPTDRFQTGREFARAVEAALTAARLHPTQGQLAALVEDFGHTRPNHLVVRLDAKLGRALETSDVTTLVPWPQAPLLDDDRDDSSPTDLHAALIRPDRTDEVSALASVDDAEGLTELPTQIAPRLELTPVVSIATRLGEALRNIGVSLPAQRVTMLDLFRGSLASPATIGWVLVVELVGTAPGKPSHAALFARVIDSVVDGDGTLDFLDEKVLRFIFIGNGAQARAVLAAQELQERMEASLDGGSPEDPRCKIALSGGHLTVTRTEPVDGPLPATVHALASSCPPGKVLMPASLANAVSDLVRVRPTNADCVELLGRRALRPVLPVVGREQLFTELSERLGGEHALTPFVVVGPPGSGKSVLAGELQRRGRIEGFTVCATRRPPSLRSVPAGAVIDLICKMADVVPAERWEWLPAALERLGVEGPARDAVLAVTNTRSPIVSFTAAQAVAALRVVIDAHTDRKRNWLLLFDGPEEMDPLSGEAFLELARTCRPHELAVALTTPLYAHAMTELRRYELPPLTEADVTEWLTALLGREPPRDLLSTIFGRCHSNAGLMVDWALLAFDLGLLRPRGEGLVLEGDFPAIRESDLPRARVRAAGTRVSRMLEAIALLRDRATATNLQAVLPDADVERLLATRMVTEVDGLLQVRSKDLEKAASRGPFAEGAAMIKRAAGS